MFKKHELLVTPSKGRFPAFVRRCLKLISTPGRIRGTGASESQVQTQPGLRLESDSRALSSRNITETHPRFYAKDAADEDRLADLLEKICKS
jgi:hypothetical protein